MTDWKLCFEIRTKEQEGNNKARIVLSSFIDREKETCGFMQIKKKGGKDRGMTASSHMH
jgi:hypothetical protein